MYNKKSVSIIIPNYNGRMLLERYLPNTLAAIRHSGADYEIIVVDDCSEDDSVSYLQEHYPGVHVHVNNENRGFSFTCNQGLRIASKDLVLLLNSDVQLTHDYFDKQWKYFNHPDTFGVMGRIMNVKRNKIEDAARYLSFSGCKIKANRFFYSTNTYGYTTTAYLSGANALIDRLKLQQIGGFNEIFSPFYSEDFELSLRAWRLGWKCYYEHASICYHQISASTNNYKTPNWVKYIYYRNKFLVHAIHLDGPLLWIWHLQILFVDFLPKLLQGKTWIIRSYIAYFKHTKEIKRAKKEMNSLMLEHNSSLTVNDVMIKMRKSMATQEVVWL